MKVSLGRAGYEPRGLSASLLPATLGGTPPSQPVTPSLVNCTCAVRMMTLASELNSQPRWWRPSSSSALKKAMLAVPSSTATWGVVSMCVACVCVCCVCMCVYTHVIVWLDSHIKDHHRIGGNQGVAPHRYINYSCHSTSTIGLPPES